jgi:hypothetical protein
MSYYFKAQDKLQPLMEKLQAMPNSVETAIKNTQE